MASADEIRAQIAALESQLVQQEASEARAAQAGNAKRAVALLAVMRAAYREIERLFPDTFDADKWHAASLPQAWPRTGKFKRIADLSDTEIHNAQEAGLAAIEKL